MLGLISFAEISSYSYEVEPTIYANAMTAASATIFVGLKIEVRRRG